MSEKLLKATHQGQLDLNGVIISCAVLSDGTRVISERSLANALGIRGGGAYWEKRKAAKNSKELMPEYLSTNNIQQFIGEALKVKLLKSISYAPKTGNIGEKSATGFPAEILPEICDVWIKANASGKLTESQKTVASNAYRLLKGFATVGIIALVDEVTGYQYDRERDELQKILKAYISADLLPWQKRFPDEFYKEIFRLKGWDYTVNGIKQRPGVIGTWTKNLIYRQLPKGVLQELIDKTPKTSTGKLAKRLHQSLTADIGNPHLEKQLVSVITLMNISKDWREFIKYFNKKFGQQELDFGEDDPITPEPKPTIPKTGFDKQLKGLLNTPPPKK